jgi:hypothetical protein
MVLIAVGPGIIASMAWIVADAKSGRAVGTMK